MTDHAMENCVGIGNMCNAIPPTNQKWVSLNSLINRTGNLISFIYCIVDVSAASAAFFGMTVHQVSLWRTVNNHRCVEVDRPLVYLSCSFLICCFPDPLVHFFAFSGRQSF